MPSTPMTDTERGCLVWLIGAGIVLAVLVALGCNPQDIFVWR